MSRKNRFGRNWFPRTRGDRPECLRDEKQLARFPRTRGDRPSAGLDLFNEEGSPAHAGDRPFVRECVDATLAVPPHTRG